MTKLDLISMFKEAIENNADFIDVFIEMPNFPKQEIIRNPKENFQLKMDYYNNAYNENCELKTFPQIKIKDITYIFDYKKKGV